MLNNLIERYPVLDACKTDAENATKKIIESEETAANEPNA